MIRTWIRDTEKDEIDVKQQTLVLGARQHNANT